MTLHGLWRAILVIALLGSCAAPQRHPVPDDPRWLTYPGGEGPVRGSTSC